jgi:RNA polymerase sigma factor (sigma-70 family)
VSHCVPRSHRSAASANSTLNLAASGSQTSRYTSKPSTLTPFLPYLSAARRYAGRKVAANEVDDIVQDSLVRIMAAQSGAEIQHPKSYLIMVVRAVIVDHLRRDTRTCRKDHLELTDATHPVDAICPCRIVMGRQELSRFTKELNALPARTRDMLLAIRVEGLSLKAAADRFDVCVSTVEKQVSRALARLAAIS